METQTVVMDVIPIRSSVLLVWMHGQMDPSLEDWQAEHQKMVRKISELNAPPENCRGLVVSDLGAPRTAQRGQVLSDIWRQKPQQSAVFTPMLENPIKRGVAAALMWMQPALKFYRPTEWETGLVHIGLADKPAQDIILPRLVEMQKRVPPNQTLEKILGVVQSRAS